MIHNFKRRLRTYNFSIFGGDPRTFVSQNKQIQIHSIKRDSH